jgi:hypothetical protein
LIDTTNYTGLAQYWWFANFQTGTLAPATGAPMNQNEARNLPSWIHLETNPACAGFADDCATPDTTDRTGFSFVESPLVSTSTGGQAGFNDLTLPNGTTGRSGNSVNDSQTGTTANYASIRILAGIPADQLRIWVVTDNGTVAGSGGTYDEQSRMRVQLRDTGGPANVPPYGADIEQVGAEALPGGSQIGSTAVGHNGTADAWSFLFTDVEEHDLIHIRPTSIAANNPAFAGIMIQVVPEPSSIALLLAGTFSFVCMSRRRNR